MVSHAHVTAFIVRAKVEFGFVCHTVSVTSLCLFRGSAHEFDGGLKHSLLDLGCCFGAQVSEQTWACERSRANRKWHGLWCWRARGVCVCVCEHACTEFGAVGERFKWVSCRNANSHHYWCGPPSSLIHTFAEFWILHMFVINRFCVLWVFVCYCSERMSRREGFVVVTFVNRAQVRSVTEHDCVCGALTD